MKMPPPRYWDAEQLFIRTYTGSVSMIYAEFSNYKTTWALGHALHTAFAVKILEETHAWRLVEAPVDIATPTAVALPAHGVAARLAN